MMEFKGLTVNQIKDKLDNIEFTECNVREIISKLSSDERISVRKLAQNVENRYKLIVENNLKNQEFYDFDRDYILNNNFVIAGCDEVGRGPLAGPIVCASVVLDLYKDENIIRGINDSKKIKSREFKKFLSDSIKDKAKKFKIIEISNDEIDKIGIGVANQKGLRDSVIGLNTNIDLVLSDGYLVNDVGYRNISVIKGDTKSASIMCASIIAKVYRDELMIKYHEEFPQYDFINNVGYGTKAHLASINKYGLCKYHRKSFLKNYI